MDMYSVLFFYYFCVFSIFTSTDYCRERKRWLYASIFTIELYLTKHSHRLQIHQVFFFVALSFLFQPLNSLWNSTMVLNYLAAVRCYEIWLDGHLDILSELYKVAFSIIIALQENEKKDNVCSLLSRMPFCFLTWIAKILDKVNIVEAIGKMPPIDSVHFFWSCVSRIWLYMDVSFMWNKIAFSCKWK